MESSFEHVDATPINVSNNVSEVNLNTGGVISSKSGEPKSYVNLLNAESSLNGEPSKKIVNFRTLVFSTGNGADVAILLASVLEVNERIIIMFMGFF